MELRNTIGRDSRGITGLETAIVLISFVVVASVFAFAVLSVGLFSAERAEETIRDSLAGARATLELKGTVIAKAATTGDAGTVDEIIFMLSNVAGGAAVNLEQGETIIRYTDDNQTFLFDNVAKFTVTPLGNANDDKLIERGELIQITLQNMVDSLEPDLSTGDTFKLDVLPPLGVVLRIERTIPASLVIFNDLE